MSRQGHQWNAGFSFVRIRSTVTWSLVWPSSWRSTACATSTWSTCPLPTTRCISTSERPRLPRVRRSLTTGSLCAPLCDTQTWSPKWVNGDSCLPLFLFFSRLFLTGLDFDLNLWAVQWLQELVFDLLVRVDRGVLIFYNKHFLFFL